MAADDRCPVCGIKAGTDTCGRIRLHTRRAGPHDREIDPWCDGSRRIPLMDGMKPARP